MSDSDDKKLITDDEWAELLHARYQTQGSPVDAVSKARSWKQLERQIAKPRRRHIAAWAALAAGLFAAVGLTQLVRQENLWREKGGVATIPVNLTAYRLAADGAMAPLNGAPAIGDTVVFRASASQQGVYAVIIRENNQSPRIAVQENNAVSSEAILLTKGGAIYGIDIAANENTTVCVIAMPDSNTLDKKLASLGSAVMADASSGCVNLKANPP